MQIAIITSLATTRQSDHTSQCNMNSSAKAVAPKLLAESLLRYASRSLKASGTLIASKSIAFEDQNVPLRSLLNFLLSFNPKPFCVLDPKGTQPHAPVNSPVWHKEGALPSICAQASQLYMVCMEPGAGRLGDNGQSGINGSKACSRSMTSFSQLDCIMHRDSGHWHGSCST